MLNALRTPEIPDMKDILKQNLFPHHVVAEESFDGSREFISSFQEVEFENEEISD